jgi:hypothetical protein
MEVRHAPVFCLHCGKELLKAAFCVHCGTPVGQTVPPKTADGKATASLVCGIISWLTLGGTFFLPIFGLILPMIGLILGLTSKRSGIATVGVWLNATSLIFTLILILCVVTIFLLFPTLLEEPPRVA